MDHPKEEKPNHRSDNQVLRNSSHVVTNVCNPNIGIMGNHERPMQDTMTKLSFTQV